MKPIIKRKKCISNIDRKKWILLGGIRIRFILVVGSGSGLSGWSDPDPVYLDGRIRIRFILMVGSGLSRRSEPDPVYLDGRIRIRFILMAGSGLSWRTEPVPANSTRIRNHRKSITTPTDHKSEKTPKLLLLNHFLTLRFTVNREKR